MNVSFGAKLITKPEEFFLRTDTPQERKRICGFFDVIKRVAESEDLAKFSKNDTIKLIRKKSKNGFSFDINYSSPELKNIKGFEKIPMRNESLNIGVVWDTIKQLTYPALCKKGYLDKSLPLFTSYDEFFVKVFHKRFNSFILDILRKK